MIIEETKTIKDMIREYGNKAVYQRKLLEKKSYFSILIKYQLSQSEESVGSYFKDKCFIITINVFVQTNLLGKVGNH